MVARVDVAADRIECVTDTLGMSPLFCVEVDGGRAISNSVEVLRRAFGLEEPDPLGTSTFLALGWAAGDRTLLDRVRSLRGGHRYVVERASLTAEPYLTPADVVPRRQPRVPTRDVARSLRAADRGGGGPRCPGAVRADGRPATAACSPRCSGAPVSRRATTRSAGTETWRWSSPEGSPGRSEWPTKSGPRTSSSRSTSTGGRWCGSSSPRPTASSSLAQIIDYADQLDPIDTIGVKLWGVGGEMTRGCSTLPRALASNLPLARHSARVQKALLRTKARSFGGLLTPDAVRTARDHLDRFTAARRGEGWRNPELSEAFFAFERVARWGSSGVRRTSGTHDVFTPFCSRAYMHYAYGLTLRESCVEAAHYQLMTLLAPDIRDLPFEAPWPPQRPARAGLEVTARATRTAAGLLARRLPRSGPLARSSAEADGAAERPPALSWLETHLDALRELCGSAPGSPLWSYVQREALEAALNTTPQARAPMADALLRVLTLFWYFHDPGGTNRQEVRIRS